MRACGGAKWIGRLAFLGFGALTACATPVPREALKGHLNTHMAQAASAGLAGADDIPAPVAESLALPLPSARPKPETFSVVVHEVRVRDLLFALARDAHLNMDIHPGLSGSVTLNAIDQTLPQILNRIARQVDMRFELDGPNLVVQPDTPFLRHYKVDYVNLSRTVSGTVATNTQISTASGNAADGALGNGNISSTRVENSGHNSFWDSLEKNIKDILHETDKLLPADAGETGEAAPAPASGGTPAGRRAPPARLAWREAASVMIHPESGIVSIRATARQHEKLREFIDRVGKAAQRQVMIEATIVEVELGDGFQQGIEWSRIWDDGRKRFSVTPNAATNGLRNATTPFVLSYADTRNPLSLTLNLLQSFGTTKVLSSPRLSVLNNQTALLKVVENVVYFNIKAEITPGNTNTNARVTYTTTPQTVSVGLVMTVTPQISDNDNIILNVRPTISNIAGMVKDPNPDIPQQVSNEIPQIRTREIESVLRLSSGQIAVLGGLMEDRIEYQTGRVPLIGQVPLAGELFTSRNNAARKSELVIFLRPIVIREPDLGGDFSGLRHYLPGADFFQETPESAPPGRPQGQQPPAAQGHRPEAALAELAIWSRRP